MRGNTNSPVSRPPIPALAWPPVLILPKDINTNPSCHRVMDPDMVLSHSSCLHINIALYNSASHPDGCGNSISMALGHQRGLR